MRSVRRCEGDDVGSPVGVARGVWSPRMGNDELFSEPNSLPFPMGD